MTIIGFTGAREVTPMQRLYIRAVLRHLPADTYVTGACTGVDEVIARAVAEYYPDARNLIVVPSGRSYVSHAFLVDMARAGATINLMAPGTTYKDRNQVIVDQSQRLVGFPAFAEGHDKGQTSGTWPTIRMARRAFVAGLHIEEPDVRILTELVPATGVRREDA
jgi:hypothetical protein